MIPINCRCITTLRPEPPMPKPQRPHSLYTLDLVPTRVWRSTRGKRVTRGRLRSRIEWFFRVRSVKNRTPITTSETYRRVNEAARQATTMAVSMSAAVNVRIEGRVVLSDVAKTKLEISGWRALREALAHPTVRKAIQMRMRNNRLFARRVA